MREQPKMQLVQVAEMSLRQLDYCIGKALGHHLIWSVRHDGCWSWITDGCVVFLPAYSTEWAATGPLLDQFNLDLDMTSYSSTEAIAKVHCLFGDGPPQRGPGRLIAACRAIVAYKLGLHDIEVPCDLP